MIRARKAPRPDAACHSADVLTPPERATERHRAPVVTLPVRAEHRTRWGDVPEIRSILLLAKRGTLCTSAN